MTWIDISQALEPGMTVWPGDAAFETFRVMSLEDGEPCNMGGIRLSLHTGTHADAPRHFEGAGAAISECGLDAFLGPAHVVEVTDSSPIARVHVDRIQSARLERVLFKTGTGVESGWHDRFSYLSVDAARELVRRGVRLVGMDTPSVDEAHSATWPAHRVFAARGVVVLENLQLSDVTAGLYELLALPLKLKNLEASPVRAVLRRAPC